MLAPTLGRDDQNGLDFKLPVYFNLAPNYDATLTPHWLSKRGLMLGGEFRYLTERSRGRFEGTYLAGDDLSAGLDPLQPDREATAACSASRTTRRSIATGTAADQPQQRQRPRLPGRLRRFDRCHLDLAARQHAGLYGRGKYWSASLTRRILADRHAPAARRRRAVSATAATAGLRHAAAVALGRGRPRISRPCVSTTSRWIASARASAALRRRQPRRRPAVRCASRFGGAAWFVTPQLAWRYTSYDSLDGTPVDDGADDSLTRSLPIASVDAGAYFERNLRLGRQQLRADARAAPVLPARALPRPVRPAGVRHPRADLRLDFAVPRQPLRRRRPPGRRQPGRAGADHAHPERRRRPRAPERRHRPHHLFRSAPGRAAADDPSVPSLRTTAAPGSPTSDLARQRLVEPGRHPAVGPGRPSAPSCPRCAPSCACTRARS